MTVHDRQSSCPMDEMQAFIDTNHDQLDNYKEEYPSVMNWIEAGMIC